jgi:N-acetylglucosaminyl-diphospho-decaprenol L-rhamnosyltransferase
MNPQVLRCFVLLVHYGDPVVTYQALASLQQGRRQPERIVVIDNGTPGGSFVSPYPGCRVIRAQRNAGYGAGLNMGLGALLSEGVTPRDIIICMNCDVEVYPETVASLLTWWQTHPAPALVGAVTEDSRQRVWGGKLNLWTGRTTLVTSEQQPRDYIHGSFFSAPYDIFMRLHGLPEHYFLYWEDVHFSYQATRAGIPLITLPTVRVRHRDSLTTRPTNQQLYYLVRNGARFLETQAPQPWKTWWWLLNRGRLLYHSLRRGTTHQLVARALADTRHNIMGQAPTTL